MNGAQCASTTLEFNASPSSFDSAESYGILVHALLCAGALAVCNL